VKALPSSGGGIGRRLQITVSMCRTRMGEPSPHNMAESDTVRTCRVQIPAHSKILQPIEDAHRWSLYSGRVKSLLSRSRQETPGRKVSALRLHV